MSILQGCLLCHFLFCVIASFCREKGHYFFNFSVLLKFFRVITWKRNFSRQNPALHLEHTVEARSTSRSGHTAPRGLGGPQRGSVAPLSGSVPKHFSHSSHAGPSTTIRRWGGISLWLDSWIFPYSKYGIILLTAEAECQAYVFSLFFLLTWMCKTFYNEKTKKH